jgi:hypothetical protein
LDWERFDPGACVSVFRAHLQCSIVFHGVRGVWILCPDPLPFFSGELLPVAHLDSFKYFNEPYTWEKQDSPGFNSPKQACYGKIVAFSMDNYNQSQKDPDKIREMIDIARAISAKRLFFL